MGPPPPPRMAGPPPPGVDAGGVAAMGLGEGAPEAVGIGRRDDEVNGVGRQATGPDRRSRPPGRRSDQVPVDAVVVIAEEHPFAPVPALGGMMRRTGDDDAGEASHGGARGGIARGRWGIFRALSP